MKKKIASLALPLLAGMLMQGSALAASEDSLQSASASAHYAVGVATNFVRDYSKPFDAWGAKYKSEDYKSWLKEVDQAGTARTTFTQIYYPTAKGEGFAKGRAVSTLPAPLPNAAKGSQISTADLFMGEEQLANMAFREELEKGMYQAFKDAPIADGKFPLVVMVHGLGGSVNTWASAAEYLASQGYVVVTVALTSDSAMTPVLHDPMSQWAKGKSADQIQAAYKLRYGNTFGTVFAGFFGYLYQYDKPVAFGDFPDPSKLTATKEGAKRSGQMMADLFNQRVEDVASVIQEMKFFNEGKDNCEIALVSDKNNEELCGFFTGKIDVDKIGVLGHSLGSMTAQAAAAFLGDVDTAVGFNNGMPRMWEPYGGIPGKPGDAAPAGVTKPLMMVIGSEDFFVHNVFRNIHGKMFEAAGGSMADNYPLKAEQVWPSEDNPQPVALSAYQRATSDKLMLTFRDQGHGHATDDEHGVFTPGAKLGGMRIPYSREAEPTPYQVLGWVKEDGKDVYLPHLMRNYFVRNWFDLQLKGDESAKDRLLNHPFKQGVKQLRSDGLQ